MKKVVFFCILFFLLLRFPVCAQTQLEALMQNYDYDIEVAGDAFADNTRRIAAGESVFSFKTVWDALTKTLKDESTDALPLLLKIIAVSVLFAVLTNMQHGLETDSIRDSVFFVCYIVVCTLSVEAFADAAATLESAVNSAVLFMNASMPILTGLMVSGGKAASAAGLNPVVLTGCVLLANLIRFFIVPMLYSIAALSMVSGVSRTVSVSALAGFLKKLVRWGLCLMLTAFSGILAVQGFGSGALDALTAKTARYIVSNGVPVVGGILSDTVDTVARSANVIKNATGAAGIIVLFTLCLVPVVKIALTSLMFHLAAAVIEPVADKRIFSAIGALGDVLSLMLGVLCAVFVMFVICISMMLSVGG